MQRTLLIGGCVALAAACTSLQRYPDDGGADGGGADGGGADAAVDAGTDERDAGRDAGPETPIAPTLRWPVNGAYTGSHLVPTDAAVVDHPLRPALMWEPVDGATEYAVQVQACGADLLSECLFDEPAIDTRTSGESAPSGTALVFRPDAALPVSSRQPVGRRYAWRVRACDDAGCGGWSAVRYLHVGRQEDDFDGDGYADLVVAAPAQDGVASSEGKVFVFYGRAGVFPQSPELTLDDPTETPTGDFGSSVAAVGDLNSDGYADLVVGAEKHGNPEDPEGAAYVYYGGLDGLPESPSVTLDNPADQPDGGFGSSVAGVGDVNADGYADFVVGARLQDAPEANEGNAFVYHGSDTGVRTSPQQTLDNPAADGASGTFGRSVAGAGDVNGDGFADVVIGAPGHDGSRLDEGAAHVYLGSRDGLGDMPDLSLENPTNQEAGSFGTSVAGAGDVNGDGFGDLVVGARAQSAPELHEGNAFVYYGARAGVPTEPTLLLDNPTDHEQGYFGESVAGAGDVNGDGFADVVVGAPRQSAPEVREGNAFVFFGRADGLSPGPARTFDSPSGQEDSWFGHAVAGAGDVNGDGFADVVVGAPFYDAPEPAEGNAFLYYGGAGGPPDAPDVSLDNPADQNLGKFGDSVATVRTRCGAPAVSAEAPGRAASRVGACRC